MKLCLYKLINIGIAVVRSNLNIIYLNSLKVCISPNIFYDHVVTDQCNEISIH